MKLNVYTDGGSRGNPGISGLGVAIFAADGKPVERRYKGLGVMTNNQAEYWGAYYGLKRAIELGADEVAMFLDSELVVHQLSGKWKIKDAGLRELASNVATMTAGWGGKVSYTAVRREKNTVADELANKAMDEQDGRVRE